jgi:hypothetical protein
MISNLLKGGLLSLGAQAYLDQPNRELRIDREAYTKLAEE